MNEAIQAFNNNLATVDKQICHVLATTIDAELTEAESKIWHSHPVWFLDGNPIVGYSKQKAGMRLMFWSGAGFEEKGWPEKGYEIQVNNSHTDWRRTGSVYGIQDVKEPPAKDNKWFTQHIIVQGNKITVKVDGKTINEYSVPAEGGKLSTGTFALQGHDPKSMVLYKDIMVKVLPD